MSKTYKITEEYVPYVTGETRKVEKKLEGKNGFDAGKALQIMNDIVDVLEQKEMELKKLLGIKEE